MMKLRMSQSFLVATSLILFAGCPTASDMQPSDEIQLGEWVFQVSSFVSGERPILVLLDGGQTENLDGQLSFVGTLTWEINGTTFDMYQVVLPNHEYFYTGELLSPTSLQGTIVYKVGGVVEDSLTWTALYRYTSI